MKNALFVLLAFLGFSASASAMGIEMREPSWHLVQTLLRPELQACVKKFSQAAFNEPNQDKPSTVMYELSVGEEAAVKTYTFMAPSSDPKSRKSVSLTVIERQTGLNTTYSCSVRD